MLKVMNRENWTPRVWGFAVAQFVAYMTVYGVLYQHNADVMSNGSWRLLLLVAVAVAAFTAAGPAMLRTRSVPVRQGHRLNRAYIVPFIPVAGFIAYYCFNTFYTWSLEPAGYAINIFCLLFLVYTPFMTLWLALMPDIGLSGTD